MLSFFSQLIHVISLGCCWIGHTDAWQRIYLGMKMWQCSLACLCCICRTNLVDMDHHWCLMVSGFCLKATDVHWVCSQAWTWGKSLSLWALVVSASCYHQNCERLRGLSLHRNGFLWWSWILFVIVWLWCQMVLAVDQRVGSHLHRAGRWHCSRLRGICWHYSVESQGLECHPEGARLLEPIHILQE